MRTLDAALEWEQKQNHYFPLVKLHLVSGDPGDDVTEATFGNANTCTFANFYQPKGQGEIVSIEHSESAWSQKATIVLSDMQRQVGIGGQ